LKGALDQDGRISLKTEDGIVEDLKKRWLNKAPFLREWGIPVEPEQIGRLLREAVPVVELILETELETAGIQTGLHPRLKEGAASSAAPGEGRKVPGRPGPRVVSRRV